MMHIRKCHLQILWLGLQAQQDAKKATGATRREDLGVGKEKKLEGHSGEA